jgi:chromosome segregation ATPase
MPDINLAFLARQLERLIEGQARLQDDMTVVMARLERVERSAETAVERLEVTSKGILIELRAMHGRHDRQTRRLDRLEERVARLEEQLGSPEPG